MNDKVNYRTCACCKNLKYKYDMARIAIVDGKALCDAEFKAGGRGMYICSQECLEKISNTKKFSKVYNLICGKEIYESIKDVLKK